MAEKDVRFLVVDALTGNVVSEIGKTQDYRILSQKNTNYDKPIDTTRIPIISSDYFRINQIAINIMLGAVTTAELKLFFFLASHLVYYSNTVKLKNGRNLSFNYISQKLLWKKKTIQCYLTSLKKAEMLSFNSSKAGIEITLNPFIVGKSRFTDRATYYYFSKSRWNLNKSKNQPLPDDEEFEFLEPEDDEYIE